MTGLLPVIDAKTRLLPLIYVLLKTNNTFCIQELFIDIYFQGSHRQTFEEITVDANRSGNASAVKRGRKSDIPPFQWLNQYRAEKNVTSILIQSIQIDGINHISAEYWRK